MTPDPSTVDVASIGDSYVDLIFAGRKVRVRFDDTDDGPLLQLQPQGCSLGGEMPGEYYLRESEEDSPPTPTTARADDGKQYLMQAEVEIVRPGGPTRFIEACVRYLGMGFHPDTPFGDYIDGEGHPTFTADEVRLLDEAMVIASDKIDVYNTAVVAMEAGRV